MDILGKRYSEYHIWVVKSATEVRREYRIGTLSPGLAYQGRLPGGGDR